MVGKRNLFKIGLVMVLFLIGAMLLPAVASANVGTNNGTAVGGNMPTPTRPYPGAPGRPALPAPIALADGSRAMMTGTGNGATISVNSACLSSVWAGVIKIKIEKTPGVWGPEVNAYCTDLCNPIWSGVIEESCGQTSAQVAWILNHYFPRSDAPSTYGLTADQKAAVVQAAIWHFTDGLTLQADTVSQGFRDAFDAIIQDAQNHAGSVTNVPTDLTLTPAEATNNLNNNEKHHTVTATVKGSNGAVMAGQTVKFSIDDSGPNHGLNGTAVTGSNGKCTWTYTSNGDLGQDTIHARVDSISVPTGMQFCAEGKQRIALAGDPQPSFIEAIAHKNWVRQCFDYKVQFVGRALDCASDKTTITYVVDGSSGSGPGLSHWVLQLCASNTSSYVTGVWRTDAFDCSSGVPTTWQQMSSSDIVEKPNGTDPTTGLSGHILTINMPSGVGAASKGHCIAFKIELSGVWDTAQVGWATKAGADCKTYGQVEGPSCVPHQGPDCSITAPASVCASSSGNTASAKAGYASYVWAVTPGSITSGQGTNSITWSAPANVPSVTIQLTVTDSEGCSEICSKDVVVNAPPQIMATGDAVCEGSTAHLTASPETGYTYSWYKGSQWKVDGATLEIASAQLSDAGIYRVIATSTTTGCSAEFTATLTVNPKPIVSVADVAVCEGSTAVLSPTILSGCSTDATYIWYKGEVVVGHEALLTIPAASAADQGQYRVDVTCTATGCQGSTTATLTVNPKPRLTATGATVCETSPATLTVSVSNLTPMTINWFKGNTQVGTGAQLVFSAASLSNAGDYRAEVTSTFGCRNMVTATLTVNALPSFSITALPVCELSTGNTASATGGFVSYVWSLSAGTIKTGQGTSNITWDAPAASASPVIITLTVTDNKGCTKTKTTTVTLNPLPSFSITASPVCELSTGNSASTTSGFASYVWSLSAGTIKTGQGTNSITWDAPAASASPVTITLTVTDNKGCTKTKTATVTVNRLPVVTLNDAEVCQGSDVTLTPSVTGDCANNVSYVWYKGTTKLSNTGATLTIHDAKSSDAGQYKVEVTCKSTGCKASDTATLTVKSLPVVDLKGATVCEGGTAVLTATVTSGCTGDVTYKWYKGSTLLSNTGATLTVAAATLADDGQYKVVVTCLATGCTGQDKADLQVNENPHARATATTPVCLGSKVYFDAHPDEEDMRYQWDFTNDGIWDSTAKHPDYTYPAPGTYTVKLRVTNHDTKCWDETTITVVVNESLLVTASPATVCEGGQTSLKATIVKGCTGNSTFAWFRRVGVIWIPVGLGDTLTFNSAKLIEGGTYKVVALCLTTGCTGEATTTLTVNPKPGATASNNGPVCDGTTVSFTGGPNGMSYQWDFTNDGTWDSTVQNPTFTYPAPGTYTAKLRVTNASGCYTEKTTTVTVNSKPDATASNNGPVCNGAAVTFTGGPNGMSYKWDFNNDGTWDSTLQNPTFTYSGPGTYTAKLRVINASGCYAETTTTVTVNSEPTPTASNSSPVCLGATVNLSAQPDGMQSYQWDVNGDGTYELTGQNPTWTPTAAGSYTVKLHVTTPQGCVADTTTVVVVNPNPQLAATGATVCLGSSATLSVTVESGCTGTTTIKWYKGTELKGTGATLTIGAVTQADAGEYRVEVTCDATGCKSSTTATLALNPQPDSSITASSAACALSTGNTASANKKGYVSYTWTLSAGTITAGQGTDSITWTAPDTNVGSVTISLTVVDDKGCSSTSTATVRIGSGTIVVIKFHDLNANGTHDGNEERLNGWTMTLRKADGTLVKAEATGGDGSITFAGLACGTYTVEETMLAGWTNSTAMSQTVTVVMDGSSEVWFGNYQLGHISGFKYNDANNNQQWDSDELPMANWEIHLMDAQGQVVATTTTAQDGSYRFDNLMPGTYTLSEVMQTGYIQSVAPAPVTLGPGQSSENNNFGNRVYLGFGSLLGAKFWDANGNGVRDADEPGLSGVGIIIRDDKGHIAFQTTTIDAPGTPLHGSWRTEHAFVPGVYTVEEVVPSGWRQDYPETNGGKYQIRINADGSYDLLSQRPAWFTGLSFGNRRYMGFKFNDLNENSRFDGGDEKLGGWVIRLRGPVQHDIVTSYGDAHSALGEWFLDAVLPEGDYVVSEVPQDGWRQTYPENNAGSYQIHLYANGSYTVMSSKPGWYDGLNFGNVRDLGGGCPRCPEWLLYQSDRADGNYEIYRSKFDGTEVQRLTTLSAADTEPTWNFPGTEIGFASNRDGNWEIYRMNPDGSGQTNVTKFTNGNDQNPSWSCQWIAFQSDRDGNWEIYKTDPDGAQQIRLTNNPASDQSPTWSPDCTTLAFQSDRDGNWEIYLMDENGNNVRRITNNAATDRNPDWSPDGKWLVYESNRDGTFQIYKVNVATGQTIRLTNNRANDTHPTWMPYCDWIFFQTDRDGSNQVYRMHADGSGQENVSRNANSSNFLDNVPAELGMPVVMPANPPSDAQPAAAVVPDAAVEPEPTEVPQP